MIKLTEHEGLSRETVRPRLAENDLKPWRKDMWCIPQVDAEYVARTWRCARSLCRARTNHPVYSRKQTIEHTGTVGVQAGLMTKEQIAAMSDDDLQKMIAVRKAELAGLGADDVRDADRDADIEGSSHSGDTTG
jgi:uncharacterized protein (DUF2132 family)